MTNIILITRDGLHVPHRIHDEDANSGTLMRPLTPLPPMVNGTRDALAVNYRRYEKVEINPDGIFVYREQP